MALYKNTSKGSTLIEVVVSVLLFGLALLVVAGLHIKSLKFNQSAASFSHMTLAANDLFELLRMNPVGSTGVSLEVSERGFRNGSGSQAEETKSYIEFWYEALSQKVPGAQAKLDCDFSGLCKLAVFVGGEDGARVELGEESGIKMDFVTRL